MEHYRRLQLGDRRYKISVSPAELSTSKQLELREDILIESIYLRCEGNNSENIVWFITDGEDYKQVFSLNDLYNRDGFAEDMPNLFHITNWDTVSNIYTAVISYHPTPSLMSRFSITISYQNAPNTMSISYEIICLTKKPSKGTETTNTIASAHTTEEHGSSYEYADQTEHQENFVPLATTRYTADVILQNDNPIRPKENVNVNITNDTIVRRSAIKTYRMQPDNELRIETPSNIGDTIKTTVKKQDRYDTKKSEQPVFKPPKSDVNMQPNEIFIPFAPPSKKINKKSSRY